MRRPRTIRWLAVAILLLSGLSWSALVIHPSSADAPLHRGDSANSGAFPGLGPDGTIGLEELWRTDLGVGVRGIPVSGDGLLVIGDTSGGVTALDLVTGDPRWTTQLADAVNASLAIADGLVLVPSNDGALTALNLADGAVRWTAHPGWHEIAAPTTGDGVVYVGTDLGVVALDLADGSVLWELPTGLGWMMSPAVADGLVYAVGHDRTLRSLDAETGAEKWRFEFDHDVIASPAVVSGRVLVVTSDGALLALSAVAGNLLWRLNEGYASAPAVSPELLFIADGEGVIHRLYPSTGTEDVSLGYGIAPGTAPVLSGDILFGATPWGFIAARADGGVIATADVAKAEDDAFGTPIVDAGAIYAVSAQGVVVSVGGKPLVLETGGRATPLRDTPLLGAPAPTAVIRATLHPGDDLLILDEPETKGSVTYWPVEVVSSGLRGWVDEQDLVATAMASDRRRPTDSYSSTS